MSAATVAAIAKAAVAVLSNEKTRKALGWVIVAILSPLIVLVVLICAVLSGSSQHNVSAVELCFHGGTISSSATPEYRGYIEDMRGSFAQLDRAIEEINAQCEDGNSLDDTRVKAVFYALYFAAEHPDDSGIRAFTDCFVDYEERTRTVTTTDEEGNEVEVEETYTVAIPVTDMNEVYARIEAATQAPVELHGSRRLRPEEIIFSDEISELDGRLNFYMDCSFNPDEVFGTHVDSADNNNWLNIYAEYDLENSQVCDALKVILCREDGFDYEMAYQLNAEEKSAILDKMGQYCREKYGQSLLEFAAEMESEITEMETPQM